MDLLVALAASTRRFVVVRRVKSVPFGWGGRIVEVMDKSENLFREEGDATMLHCRWHGGSVEHFKKSQVREATVTDALAFLAREDEWEKMERCTTAWNEARARDRRDAKPGDRVIFGRDGRQDFADNVQDVDIFTEKWKRGEQLDDYELRVLTDPEGWCGYLAWVEARVLKKADASGMVLLRVTHGPDCIHDQACDIAPGQLYRTWPDEYTAVRLIREQR